MYKLVNGLYESNKTFITDEDNILKGFYLDNDNYLLTNIDEKTYEDFVLQQKNHCEYNNFSSYLDHLGIEYISLPSEKYVDEETVNEWLNEYKYCYYDHSLYDSSFPFGDYVEYYEYYDGHNWKQIELEILDDVDKIDSGIEYDKYGQSNLYKSLYNDTLYLNYVSLFIGNLGDVQEITTEELKERFDYELPDFI